MSKRMFDLSDWSASADPVECSESRRQPVHQLARAMTCPATCRHQANRVQERRLRSVAVICCHASAPSCRGCHTGRRCLRPGARVHAYRNFGRQNGVAWLARSTGEISSMVTPPAAAARETDHHLFVVKTFASEVPTPTLRRAQTEDIRRTTEPSIRIHQASTTGRKPTTRPHVTGRPLSFTRTTVTGPDVPSHRQHGDDHRK